MMSKDKLILKEIKKMIKGKYNIKNLMNLQVVCIVILETICLILINMTQSKSIILMLLSILITYISIINSINTLKNIEKEIGSFEEIIKKCTDNT